MTGKEAADKAKSGWQAVTAWSTFIFIACGIGGVAISQSYASMLGWLKDPAVALAIIGAVKSIVQGSAKKVSEEVPAATVAQFYKEQGALELKVKQGESDHKDCMGHHERHDVAIGKLQSDMSQVVGVVGELKQGWKLNAGM